MQENTEKITREFCKGKILVFRPNTEAEAAFIQNKLFAMGYGWISTGVGVWRPDRCVSEGVTLSDGSISCQTHKDGILCTSAQFDEAYNLNNINCLSGDALVREAFNKLSARIEKIEAQVAELYREVMPKTLDKPAFKRPGAEG